jgi:hypothetical protein
MSDAGLLQRLRKEEDGDMLFSLNGGICTAAVVSPARQVFSPLCPAAVEALRHIIYSTKENFSFSLDDTAKYVV